MSTKHPYFDRIIEAITKATGAESDPVAAHTPITPQFAADCAAQGMPIDPPPMTRKDALQILALEFPDALCTVDVRASVYNGRTEEEFHVMVTESPLPQLSARGTDLRALVNRVRGGRGICSVS